MRTEALHDTGFGQKAGAWRTRVQQAKGVLEPVTRPLGQGGQCARCCVYAVRMRALLGAVIAFALALSMPIQSFAASFLLTGNFGSTRPAAASVAVDVDRINGAGSLLEPVASVARASLSDKKPTGTRHEIHSSACCFAAMAVKQWTIDLEPVSAVYARTNLLPHDSLSIEVLERPPRTYLA